MSATNLYEQIIDVDSVEQAMKATLQVWLSDYLGELERTKGYQPGQIARPRGVITASEFDKFAEDELPLVMIVSPGLEGPPTPRKGSGSYEASWSITVAAIVSDVGQVETRRLMSAYAAAIRAAVMQHKMLRSPLHPEGFARFVTWKGESYSDLPFADTRSLDSCRVVFGVGVESVVTEQAGPRAPSAEPASDPGQLPVVKEVDVTVTPERATV